MNDSSYSNKDGVASSTWPDPQWAMEGYPYYPDLSVPQSTHHSLISAPGYTSNAGWPESYIPDFNATHVSAFAPTFANLPTQVDFTHPNVPDPYFMQAPSPSNAKPAVSQPQLVGNLPWPWTAPLATDSVAAIPHSGVSPTSSTPIFQDTWEWPFDFVQSPATTPASPAAWDASEFSWPNPVASGHLTATYPPTTALGKRHRKAEEPQGDHGGLMGINAHNMPAQKRARGRASEILKEERSAARTRHNLVARVPETSTNDEPEEAGRGAERLATPIAHGFHHQSLLGPSFQQGCAVEPADGKPTRVEGSVGDEGAHRIDSAVRQQHEGAIGFFEIPCKFKYGFRLLLQASEADIARGAVREIKCRLCPDTKLKDFEEFKRHAKTAETHPLEVHFCDLCGDFFASRDSLKRHENRPPNECSNVTPVEAAKKRRATEAEHKSFMQRLRHCLETGEDIGRGFSQIIKEKYPKSSKKKKRTGGRK